MTQNMFDYHVNDLFTICSKRLTKKASMYQSEDGDRLQHFKQAGILLEISPEQALFSQMCKHIISCANMCKDPLLSSNDVWVEKIGDIVCYCALLYGLIKDRDDIR